MNDTLTKAVEKALKDGWRFPDNEKLRRFKVRNNRVVYADFSDAPFAGYGIANYKELSLSDLIFDPDFMKAVHGIKPNENGIKHRVSMKALADIPPAERLEYMARLLEVE